jgi:hypothetical protein
MTYKEIENKIKAKGLKKSFVAKQIGVKLMDLSHALTGNRKSERYIKILIKAEKFLKK